MADTPEALPAPSFAETPSYWETDPATLDKIKEAAIDHLTSIQESNPATKSHAALLANELGHKLVSSKEHRAAYQCYQYAFQITKPYDVARAIYAENLIGALHSYREAEGIDKNDNWFTNRREILDEAIGCLKFNLDIHRQQNFVLAATTWVDAELKKKAEKANHNLNLGTKIIDEIPAR